MDRIEYIPKIGSHNQGNYSLTHIEIRQVANPLRDDCDTVVCKPQPLQGLHVRDSHDRILKLKQKESSQRSNLKRSDGLDALRHDLEVVETQVELCQLTALRKLGRQYGYGVVFTAQQLHHHYQSCSRGEKDGSKPASS